MHMNVKVIKDRGGEHIIELFIKINVRCIASTLVLSLH